MERAGDWAELFLKNKPIHNFLQSLIQKYNLLNVGIFKCVLHHLSKILLYTIQEETLNVKVGPKSYFDMFNQIFEENNKISDNSEYIPNYYSVMKICHFT